MEDDPSYKQIIPYCLILQASKVFIYRRSKKSGESKLHAKQSVGVGGHINPEDVTGAFEGTKPLDQVNPEEGFAMVKAALLRELREEINLPDAEPNVRIGGLINDENDPVGTVHLGFIAIVEVGPGEITPNEDTLADPRLLNFTQLQSEEGLESWSKIAVDHIEEVIPLTSYHFNVGCSLPGPLGLCGRIKARGQKEALAILQEELPETIEVSSNHAAVEYIHIYTNSEALKVTDISELEETES